MKTLFTYMLLLISISALSQLKPIQSFSDSTIRFNNYNLSYIKLDDGMLIKGRYVRYNTFFDDQFLMRIDTLGNIVWNTLPKNMSDYWHKKIDLKIIDSNIIALGKTTINNTDYRTINKISITNGDIIWSKKLNIAINDIVKIIDYDSISFLTVESGSGNSIEINYFSKLDGNIISQHILPITANYLSAAMDVNKNIYVGFDNQIVKYNKDNFNEPLWTKNYEINTNDPIKRIFDLYLDDFDQLFIFGDNNTHNQNGDNPLAAKVNINNGNIIWQHIIYNYYGHDMALKQFIDKDNDLYAIYKHTTSGDKRYQVSRIKKSDGTEKWYKSLDISADPNIQMYTNNSYSMAFDLNCAGDVIVTGTSNGTWAILKLSGLSGNLIDQTIITLDSSSYDDNSAGTSVCSFGDFNIIIGHIDLGNYAFTNYFVKMNAAGNSILDRKLINPNLAYQSSVLDIVNVNDSIYVLKQKGNNILFELYKPDKTLAWIKVITQAENCYAKKLAIGDNFAFVSCEITEVSNENPYTTQISEDAVLFKIDRKTGATNDSTGFETNTDRFQALQLFTKNDTVYFLYNLDNYIKIRSWNTQYLSNEKSLEYRSNLPDEKTKSLLLVEKNTEYLIFSAVDKLIQIKKSDLSISYLYNYSQQMIPHGLYVKQDELFMVGETASANPFLLSYNLNNNQYNYTNQLNVSGKFQMIAFDSLDNLYCAGQINNQSAVYKMNKSNGNILWQYNYNNSQVNTSGIYDISSMKNGNYVGTAGYTLDNGNNFKLQHLSFYYDGDTLLQFHSANRPDTSFFQCIEQINDTTFWLGGSEQYSLPHIIEGVVYEYAFDTTSVNPIGFNTFERISDISISPNPTDNDITINGLKCNKYNYILFNLQGKLLDSKESYLRNTISLQGLNKGVYILVINTELKTKVFKVIKQ